MSDPPLDPEKLLGKPMTLRRRDVSRAAGVSLVSARRFWRALGFPNVGDDVTAFTEADVLALHRITTLVRDGLLDEATALGMTRAIGRSADRLASWQVQLLAEYVAGLTTPEDADDDVDGRGSVTPDADTAQRAAELFSSITDELEPLLLYAWRRQAASAIARIAADAAPDRLKQVEEKPGADAARDRREASRGRAAAQPAEADLEPSMIRAVGFADLVSFTRLVRRLTERELADLVERFEVLTSDIVAAHGGRVIKTVGDEVMFASMPGAGAAAIALDIAQTLAEDERLPDVRVGLATGPVVSRLGDVFGTTVNRASRLTALAQPGTVLVDVATVHSLAGVPKLEMRQLRGRTLRGLGHVVPWVLQRAGAAPLD
jgi:adenylate cyclase